MVNSKKQKLFQKIVLFIAFIEIFKTAHLFASNNNDDINYEEVADSGIPRTWSVPIQLNTADLFETEANDENVTILQSPSTDFKSALQILNDGVPVDKSIFCRMHDTYLREKELMKRIERKFVELVIIQKNPHLSALIDQKNKIENLYIADHYLDNLTFDKLLSHIIDEAKKKEAADYVSRELDKIQKKISVFMAPLDEIMGGNELWEHWKQCLCSRPMSINDRIKIITKGKTLAGINSSTIIFVSLNDFLQTNPDLRAKFDMNLFYKISSEIRLITANVLINLESYFANNDETWILFKWGCLAGDICVVPWRHIIGDIVGNAISEAGEFRATLVKHGTHNIVKMFDCICSTRTQVELTIFKCEVVARALWGQNWIKGGKDAVRTQSAEKK